MEDQLRPDTRHRKALRASAMALHALATDMKKRRGHIPADEPAGYVDAFSVALRERAVMLERVSGSTTCAQAKRMALDVPGQDWNGNAAQRAGASATNALLGIVNRHAQRERLDPYGGVRQTLPTGVSD